jgi:predicted nucleic acid-binding protein
VVSGRGELIADCSALVAVLFNEPQGEGLDEVLDQHDLVAPPLLRYELANATWKKVHIRGWLRDAALAILDDALRLPIRYVDVEYNEVVQSAVETGLSAYDASYLWLSETRDLPLVCLDSPLQRVYNGRH